MNSIGTIRGKEASLTGSISMRVESRLQKADWSKKNCLRSSMQEICLRKLRKMLKLSKIMETRTLTQNSKVMSLINETVNAGKSNVREFKV